MQVVLSFFQTMGDASEAGATVREAADALAPYGLNLDEVRQYIENLVGDGFIYSTIDTFYRPL